MTEEQKTMVEETLPQVAILQSIQKNMFCDVALENISIIILGEAIRRTPELNNLALFADVKFDEKNNNDWEKYDIGTMPAWSGYLGNILTSFDAIVEQVIKHLLNTVEKTRIVAGTLRMRATDNTPTSSPGTITLELLWIEEKNEDE